MTFIDWLYGTYGIMGNYDYGTMYMISVSIIFAVFVIFAILAASKLSDKVKRIILVSFAIFQLVFEVLWRIIFLCRGDALLSLWPFYICNLNGILIPIAVLAKSKVMKNLFYVFGFIGALITFALPQGIFNNAYLVFPILKSLLQHTGILIIPMFEFVSGTFRPKLKEMWIAIAGLVVHLFNSTIIATLFNYKGDYLYFNSGLPFTIPGVPGWLIMSATALIVLFITYLLLNIKPLNLKMKRIKKNKYDQR